MTYNVLIQNSYVKTICPICGLNEIEHFIINDIDVDAIIEEPCQECKLIMKIR